MAERDLDLQRVQALFEQAVSIPNPSARREFLRRECGDSDLYKFVESLVERDDSKDGFLDVAPLLDFEGILPRSFKPFRVGVYEVLEELGKGGMGVVYKARDTRLKRLVALKVISPQRAHENAWRQRFFREATSVAAIQHDHVVRIYDVSLETDADAFLAMEFLEGESLENHLTRVKRLPVSDVLRIGREIAQGLAAAHARSIIHRDIKPANIFLEFRPGERQRVKILDFGLARPLSQSVRLTQTGAAWGTPVYMAPEQLRGAQDLDARCDLYALGVVLHQMATGEIPAGGVNKLAAAAIPRTDQTPRLLDALADLITRMLSEDPNKRPESAESVARDLQSMEILASSMAGSYAGGDQVTRTAPQVGVRRLTRGRDSSIPGWIRSTVRFVGRVSLTDLFAWVPAKAVAVRLSLAILVVVLIGLGAFRFGLLNTKTIDGVAAAPRAPAGDPGFRVSSANITKMTPPAPLPLKSKRPNTAIASTTTGWSLKPVSPPANSNKVEHPKRHTARRKDSNRQNGADKHTARPRQLASRLGTAKPPTPETQVEKPPDEVALQPEQPVVVECGRRQYVGFVSESLRNRSSTNGPRFLIPGTAAAIGPLSMARLYRCRGSIVPAKEATSVTSRREADVWIPFEYKAMPFEQSVRQVEGKQGVFEPVGSLSDGVYCLHTGTLQGPRPPAFCCPIVVRGWSAPAIEKTSVETGATEIKLRVLVRNTGTGQLNDGHVTAIIEKRQWRHTPPSERSKLSQKEVLAAISPGGQSEIELTWRSADLKPGSYHIHGQVNYERFVQPDPPATFDTETFSLGEATAPPWQGKEVLVLSGHQGWVKAVAFNPDGRHIASCGLDGMVKVWDLSTRRETFTFEMPEWQNGKQRSHMSRWVNAVAFRSDKTLASGNEDGTITRWGSYTGRKFPTLRGHGGSVNCLAFSPDGKRLVSGSSDRTVRIWDATGGMTLQGHTGSVNGVAFSPGGKWVVSGSEDKTLKIWDAAGNKETITLTGHQSGVSKVAVSPDGKRIASASYDSTVKLWDVASAKETITLKGHFGGVYSVAFSPNGKYIASGGDDSTVRMWDSTTGRCLFVFEGHNRTVSSVAFSPDGSRIASSGDLDAAYRGYILVFSAAP